MKRYWMFAAVTLALALAAGPALAKDGPGGKGPGRRGRHMRHRGPGMRRGPLMLRLGEKLELGEQQKKKIAEIREAAREKIKAADSPEKRHEIMKQVREDSKNVLTAEQLKKLEELRKEHGLGLTEEQREKMAQIRKKAHEEVKKVLTEEQLKKQGQLRRRFRDGRHHFGPHLGPRPEE